MVNHRLKMLSLMNITWLCLVIIHHTTSTMRMKRFRRWWVRPHLREGMRARYGAYSTIFEYFKLRDEEEFYHFVGMPLAQFERLYQRVRHHSQKHSPRGSLHPKLKLAAVLK
ncbi:hypothetical protein QAD02_002428 [Eretmocerus hayati]|uniref:Uncharacterized protein n=1 Tax=Eretmocerus hayati TaxID=131215 RepID=A0ACC2NIV1_9HYME|nr:hypothetical protein QAD02_002428 [Eretmocerus hayati]